MGGCSVYYDVLTSIKGGLINAGKINNVNKNSRNAGKEVEYWYTTVKKNNMLLYP